MSSSEVSYILKGCNAKFINKLVKASINGNNITGEILDKSLDIIKLIDLNECRNIINNFSTILDINLKESSNPEIKKLDLYRQIALLYIKKIIEAKIIAKFDKAIFKKEVRLGKCDSTCSICLENIENDIQYTRCNHAFHRTCMTKWGRIDCPLCRGHS